MAMESMDSKAWMSMDPMHIRGWAWMLDSYRLCISMDSMDFMDIHNAGISMDIPMESMELNANNHIT